jgi:hypothetical protein
MDGSKGSYERVRKGYAKVFIMLPVVVGLALTIEAIS